MADNKKVKEVSKEDVKEYSEVYNEHFTEKMLVEKARDFIYNYLFQNDIYSKESDWEGGRAVFGQLPFGDPAVYVVKKSKKGTVKATVTATIDPDKEEIVIGMSAPGCKYEEKTIRHLTIKHGHINWYDLDAPDMNDVKISDSPMTNAFKDTNPSLDNAVRPKMRQQPQIPAYMLPYGYGF